MTERKGKKETLSEEPARRETYEFTAFVSGPLIRYEITAKDFDEAYGTGMSLLMKQMERYKGKVEIGKIQVERWTDNF